MQLKRIKPPMFKISWKLIKNSDKYILNEYEVRQLQIDYKNAYQDAKLNGKSIPMLYVKDIDSDTWTETMPDGRFVGEIKGFRVVAELILKLLTHE